ncbi:MAG: acyltransferase family protein [Ilumatobacteraceae bacterium]
MERLPAATGLGYRPGLDGLRALAVVSVIGFHSGVFDWGWVGVDVFFALSGWLITGLVIDEIERTDRLSLRAFWARRARRLFPALGVSIVLVAVLGLLDLVDIRRRGLLGAATYATNWLNITGGRSYWDEFANPDPLEHLWSLAIEEQIYLVWPMLIAGLVIIGRSRVGIRVAAAAIVVLSFGFASYGASNGWSIDRLYQGTDTRASTFALGAVVAGLSLRRLPSWANHLLLITSLALGAWMARHGVGDTDMFRGRMLAISLCGLVAVISAAAITSGPLCNPVLRRLGLWSYGLYLFHRPVAIALESISIWIRFALVVAITIALASVSYHLVEQPIRRRSSTRGLPLAVVASTCIALSVGVAVAKPVAPPDEVVTSIPLPVRDSPTSETPELFTPPPRVLMIGDSVPALASRQIASVGSEMGFEVGVSAEAACVPSPHAVDQYLPDLCTPFIESLDDTIRNGDPDFVVFWWGGTGGELSWNGSPIEFCRSEGRDAIRNRVNWLQTLASDHQAVIVLPVPRLDISTEQARGTICESETIRNSIDSNRTFLLPLADIVCPSFPDDCDAIERVDGLHYSTRGAEEVARWMFGEIRKLVTDEG